MKFPTGKFILVVVIIALQCLVVQFSFSSGALKERADTSCASPRDLKQREILYKELFKINILWVNDLEGQLKQCKQNSQWWQEQFNDVKESQTIIKEFINKKPNLTN